MKNKELHNRLSNWGALLFLVLISISSVTTTQASRIFIEVGRYVTIVSLVALIAIIIILARFKKSQVLTLLILGFLTLYGIIASHLSGSLAIGSENLIRNVSVVLVGTFIFSGINGEYISDSISKKYALFIVAGFIITIVVGGIDLSFPPRFLFDYSSDISGSNILYTQNITKFFGFGAIASIYIASQERAGRRILLWLLVTFVLLTLSILGGARGDAIATITVIFGYIIYKYQSRYILLFIVLSVFTLLVIEYWNVLIESFVFFRRLLSIEQADFGMRDILALDVIQLLTDKPNCLLWGCGFGYFQYYYNYDFGLYPHNVLLESIIVFGLPLTLAIVLAGIGGARIYFKRLRHVDLLILFLLASVIIDLKSGYVFGNWLSLAVLLCFCGLFLAEVLRPARSLNKSFH